MNARRSATSWTMRSAGTDPARLISRRRTAARAPSNSYIKNARSIGSFAPRREPRVTRTSVSSRRWRTRRRLWRRARRKFRRFEARLADVASAKSLEIRGREEARAFARAERHAAETIATLRERAEKNRVAVAERNAKYRDETFSRSEYAPETADAFSARLSELDAAAERSEAANLERVADLEERARTMVEEAHASFLAVAPHHAEDVAVVDAVERATERARRDVRDLIAKSVDDGVKLAEMTRDIENIGARRWPDPKTARSDDAAATETLRRLDRLREALSARSTPGRAQGGRGDCARARARLPRTQGAAHRTGRGRAARSGRGGGRRRRRRRGVQGCQENHGRPGGGRVAKTMLRLTDELVESTRVAVKAAAEPYYAEKDPERAITRPDKIPPTLEELCAGKEAIVAELREEVAKHAEKAGAEARLVVVGIGDFVANAAEALTERALRDVTNRVDAAFHRVTAEHTPSGESARGASRGT